MCVFVGKAFEKVTSGSELEPKNRRKQSVKYDNMEI